MALKLEPKPPGPIEAPPDRGRLMTAKQVAEGIFGGSVSAAWVRRTVGYKRRLGHSTVRWFESDVLAWINEQEMT